MAAASSDLEAAAAARDAGDFAQAIEILERADVRTPNDPNVLRLLGTSYGHAGRFAEALATLRRARAIAPADRDIALAIARVQLWSGDPDAAAETIAEIARTDPGNAELPGLVKAIDRARQDRVGNALRPSLALSQSLSRVRIGGGTRRWYGTAVTLAVPASTRTTVSLDLDRESRGVAVDQRGQLRLDRRFHRGSAYIAASATPDADFRERWAVRTGGEVSLTTTLTLTGDLRYADYGATRVVAAEPGISLGGAADRWTLSLRSINLWDETDRHRSGWALRGALQATGRLRLIAGGATYPDTEAGITRQLRSAFAGAVLTASDDVALRVTYEHEDRRDSYVRDTIVLGIGLRL